MRADVWVCVCVGWGGWGRGMLGAWHAPSSGEWVCGGGVWCGGGVCVWGGDCWEHVMNVYMHDLSEVTLPVLAACQCQAASCGLFQGRPCMPHALGVNHCTTVMTHC
jgi:hypothetical protein